MSTKKESCGCGFGHSVKKVHFGNDLPTFYKQNATNTILDTNFVTTKTRYCE